MRLSKFLKSNVPDSRICGVKSCTVKVLLKRHLVNKIDTNLTNFVILFEGDMEALALEATVVFEATAGVSGMDCPACLVRRDVLENIPCMGVHCKKYESS